MGTHSTLGKELQRELRVLPILHQRKLLDIVRLIKKGAAPCKKDMI